MPKKTGIINREEYLQRLFKEDSKIAKKDQEYGNYLNSLSRLLMITNEIYAKKNGKLDKESYENLVKQYVDVANKAVTYMEKKTSPARANVVEYIQKIVSKDLMALNSLDKNNPGMLDDAFEASRAMRVEIPQELSHRVGGQMSDRFPVKSNLGAKGYFTARTSAAQDAKWDKLLKSIGEIGLDQEYMDIFNDLRTNHQLRMELQEEITYKEEHTIQNFLVKLNICKKRDWVEGLLQQDEKLAKAMKILATEGVKLLHPYNMVDRLGYDPYTRNDNKNAAMYAVAKRLGCERILAKAVPMVVVNGNQAIKGTFMENAEGNDLANLKPSDPLFYYDPKESPYHKELFRDLADMQVLDYICGNVDRHKGNMLYKTEKKDGKVKITGIVGIDNDASFPENNFKNFEFEPRNQFVSATLFKPENFQYVNKNTREIILNLNRADLELILRGHNISKKAIDLAWKRTKEVKKVLTDPEKYKIKFADDLDENITRTRTDSSNPFKEGDYSKNPSIFTGFDRYLSIQVANEQKKASIEQIKRLRENKNFAEATRLEYEGKINVKELSEHMNAKEKEREGKFAEFQAVTRESAILAESLKIDGMDALMDRVNRLKTPTKEFEKMRDAVSALKTTYLQIANKIVSKETVLETDYKNYQECLDTLNQAAKIYIQKKSITPKTGNGLKRLEAATSIENRVEELIANFETDIKISFEKAKNTEDLPEKEQNDNIELN